MVAAEQNESHFGKLSLFQHAINMWIVSSCGKAATRCYGFILLRAQPLLPTRDILGLVCEFDRWVELHLTHYERSTVMNLYADVCEYGFRIQLRLASPLANHHGASVRKHPGASSAEN